MFTCRLRPTIQSRPLYLGNAKKPRKKVQISLVQLGKRVQRPRKGKGWTQTELAVYLDMNRGHISDIERGKREVGIITLQVIAKGLDTTMSNLLKSL